MSDESWPKPLEPVHGPFPADKIDGAAGGMGEHGPTTRTFAAEGWVQPDLMIGMTLFLLARQPRRSTSTETSKKATPIDGGVWVREQFTIHQPLRRDDRFEITGESTGRYVRKGRRYGTNRSVSHNSSGELVATNLTTGLISYKAEAGRDDEIEGLSLDQTPAPEPDWEAARSNPHLEAIASTAIGTDLGGASMFISPAMLTARAGAKPDNPIHNDPEAAKRAGLAKPIAGGSHVAAFALEPLLATWGLHALSYGTKFDLRWRAPTEADVAATPAASVVEVHADRVVVDVTMTLVDGPTAMVGTLTIPLST